jgi:hypothetical protein
MESNMPLLLQKNKLKKKKPYVWAQWLKPGIAATQDVIRRITVQGQPKQKVSETHLNQ